MCDCAVLFDPTFFLPNLSKVETTLTAMAFTVDAIEKIVEEHRTSNDMELRAVHAVASAEEGNESNCKVDRLAAIWTPDDASGSGKTVEMYETLSGYTHGLARVRTPVNGPGQRKLCIRFPVT
jgi:hypothetical protein